MEYAQYHAELGRLWLASRSAGAVSRYERLCWIAREYHKAHPDISEPAAYKLADTLARDGIHHG